MSNLPISCRSCQSTLTSWAATSLIQQLHPFTLSQMRSLPQNGHSRCQPGISGWSGCWPGGICGDTGTEGELPVGGMVELEVCQGLVKPLVCLRGQEHRHLRQGTTGRKPPQLRPWSLLPRNRNAPRGKRRCGPVCSAAAFNQRLAFAR